MGTASGRPGTRIRGWGHLEGPDLTVVVEYLMRRFVKGWKAGGHGDVWSPTSSITRTTSSSAVAALADEAMGAMREMMSKLKLTVNETKTRLCQLPEEAFDFLGYTLGRNSDRRTGRPIWGRDVVKEDPTVLPRDQRDDGSRTTLLEVKVQVGRINANSGLVQLFPHRDRQPGLPQHRRPCPLWGRQWLCIEVKVPGKGKTSFPDAYLYGDLKLYRLQRT